MKDIKRIAEKFNIQGVFQSASEYGEGHINETYLLEYEIENTRTYYLLQKISEAIFDHPKLMMENISRVLSYVHAEDIGLCLIETKEGNCYYKDPEGGYYRIYTFLEQAVSYDRPMGPWHVYECGRMTGIFLKALTGFSFDPAYYEMTKDFHNAFVRYEQFLEAVRQDKYDRVRKAETEIAFYKQMQKELLAIYDLEQEKKLPYRVTHNDLRLSNVMLDKKTNKALTMVDLDTVMPGLAAYDYGDAIRSAGKVVFRNGHKIERVELRLPVVEQFTKGYLEEVGGVLTEEEILAMPKAILVMTLECGIRYLTDYLNGDVYFAKNKNGENKENAKREMLFAKEIIAHRKEIEKIVADNYQEN